jgi:hypothetical protein
MRIIIGEYESLALATSAVNALQSSISIQTIVIGDQSNHTFRKRDPERDRKLNRPSSSANFLVSMSGSAQDIARARSLLSAQVTPV